MKLYFEFTKIIKPILYTYIAITYKDEVEVISNYPPHFPKQFFLNI